MSDNSLKKGRYTRHSNKIGLYSTSHDRIGFLNNNNDVVLSFPFKDTVLEAGMNKEDTSREERFLHQEVDGADIDTLFEPKTFTNFQLIGSDKNIQETTFFDENGDLQQNLLIKGNNLLALHSLSGRLAGKVKLIYIDPPYNTGNDGFKYNDSFNHSSWLIFMKNRLEIARDLLSDDGVIFISLDDKESHYCKVLMDEIFGRENFIADICHKSRASISNDKIISPNHNNILFFAKNERILFSIKEKIGVEKSLDGFNHHDENGDYKLVPVDGPGGASKGNPYYEFLGVTGYWRFSKERMQKMYEEGLIVKTAKGLQQKYYKYKAALSKQTVTTWWDEGFLTSSATSELKKLMNGDFFKNPKNENLLKKIIELVTDENDIVLDYHLGSGTTCAVAHKMGRRWIGIEQMDYIEDITKERLKKVIEGEQGGISKAVGWQGGGSFVYFELKKYNQDFLDKIMIANSKGELDEVYNEMAKNAFLKFWFDKNEFEKDENFRSLDLDRRKELLIGILDENQLYLNYADMRDSRYHVTDEEMALTDLFYGANND